MLQFKKNLVLLLCIFCLMKVEATESPIMLNIRDFGAIPNDNQDDKPAFAKVLARIKEQPGDYRIFIPRGTYNIKSRIGVVGLKGNISFEGENGTIIKTEDEWFLNLQANSVSTSLQGAANRNDSVLNLSSASTVKFSPGDIIHIQSSTVFETGWKYKENDLHQITRINGKRVALSSKLLFNYTPESEKVTVKIFNNAALSFKNISIVMQPVKDNVRAYIFSFTGFSVKMSGVEFSYAGKLGYYHNAVFLSACHNVYFENMKFSNLQYGVTMNYCRNITALNTEGIKMRHIYTPTTATANVNINGLKGINCQSAMDAHVAFHVTYENVLDTLATKYPNCRALGLTVKNARIYMSTKEYMLYAYWSVQTLTQEYRPIYTDYESHFSNVHWVSPMPGKFNGINTYISKRLIVENCTTNSVSCYGGIQKEMIIRNCTVGSITGFQKIRIENTVMNGKLYPNTPYVFKFRGQGATAIDNVKVQGYDQNLTYLFGEIENSPKHNSLELTDLVVSPLKGWTNKVFGRGTYTTLKVVNSKFTSFKEPVQPEFSTAYPPLKTIKTN